MDVLNGWPNVQVSPAAASGLGVTLSVIGSVLYLRDVRHRRTTPHRGSWLVWGVIALVAALSNGFDGGRWSLVVLWGQALSTLAVLLVAFRCGVGWLTRTNLLMLSVAALGIVGWTTLANPTAASACAAAADAAGLLAIAPKIWLDAYSETLATYALAGATGLLAVLAVQAWDLGLLLYPVYFCLGNAATATLIAARRRMVQPGAPVVDLAAERGAGSGPPVSMAPSESPVGESRREGCTQASGLAGQYFLNAASQLMNELV
jgi:hypothetical protein